MDKGANTLGMAVKISLSSAERQITTGFRKIRKMGNNQHLQQQIFIAFGQHTTDNGENVTHKAAIRQWTRHRQMPETAPARKGDAHTQRVNVCRCAIAPLPPKALPLVG